jgi:hypothetical protein
MTPLTALWLPIVVSAVLVFIASSILHMATKWHAKDYRAVPNDKAFAEAIGPLGIPPGDYMSPRAQSSAEMKSPEFTERMNTGPVVMFTVLPPGIAMGRALALWFVHLIIVSIFSAYIASRALPPGANYLEVFRFAGATAFIAHAAAVWPMWIWYRRDLGTTIRSTIDGLIYGLLTAGVFGWLWP